MNICFLAGNMSDSGGTERMTQLLSDALVSEDGFEVFVLSKCDNEKRPYFQLNDKVHYSTLDNGEFKGVITLLKDIFLLRKFIRKNKIDVLINVEVSLGIFSLPLKVICPHLKQVFWEHFCVLYNVNNRRMKTLRRLALKFGNAYVTLTSQDADILKKEYKPRCRVFNVPNICSYALSENRYNKDSKTIITIGNFISAKGIDLALTAATQVAKRHPDWRWEIYGDGSKKEILIKQVMSLGIDDFVHFMGRTKNLKSVYESAAIYVLPSRSEGFGLVIIEAQSHRLPTVAFDVPYGPRNIIDDGINGNLIEPFDTDAMANAICELIENEEKRVTFSDNSIKNLDRYSAENVTQKWKKILGEL